MPRTRKSPAKSAGKPAAETALSPAGAPVHPPGAPESYRARVRMYRQGLGDCFLLTFPRDEGDPFHLLIDCGVLQGTRERMTEIVAHIRDTVRREAGSGDGEKARLDVVVGTHEHKDHLSGFNQARALFNKEFDFGAVWLPWTENLGQPEARKIKEARRTAAAKLQAAVSVRLPGAAADALDGMASLMGFSTDDDTSGAGKISEALDYLKLRGTNAGDLRYLEPGTGPFGLEGVDGVRVYVLGPPTDAVLLKQSEVTAQAKKDDVVYHLAGTGMAGVDALCAALPDAAHALGSSDRYHPFSAEHRIAPHVPDSLQPGTMKPSPYYEGIRRFVETTYEDPAQDWRRIDNDWLNAFGQLALDLDSDTNNTSLVLAFEFEKTGEVLLFVGDAQVGNWRSWADVRFTVPGRGQPLPAHDLLNRTVFYKVGHHCSHNATLKRGGLELMTRDDLVAFIPLDKGMAARQGKRDPQTGKPRGWEMPAPPLFKALREKAKNRVVISDAAEPVPQEAADAGVLATDTFIDYYLRYPDPTGYS